MTDGLIDIFVRNPDGSETILQAPTDMSLSLMEILKGEGYPIQATCGGMALCATCHIEVLEGLENLDPQGDSELDMLETVPTVFPNSRLSCQIKIHENVDGIKLRVIGGE